MWCWIQVRNKIIHKRIHVRVEHVQPSRCHEDFLQRVKKNDQLKAEARAQGKIISTKRQPQGPKPGFMVEGTTLETVTPIPYDVVNDLKGGYWGCASCNCCVSQHIKLWMSFITFTVWYKWRQISGLFTFCWIKLKCWTNMFCFLWLWFCFIILKEFVLFLVIEILIYIVKSIIPWVV